MFRHFILTSIVAAFAAATLLASDFANLSGSVVDSSGAAVANAKIILHRANADAALSSASNAAGQFSFGNVPPGDYFVEASAPGLALTQNLPLRLASGDLQNLALQLGVTALTTQIDVTSAGLPQPVDQTAKALDVVNADEAQQHGLISAADALETVPGLQVSTMGGPGAFTTIQTRGLRVTDTSILIDGLPFRDPTAVQDEASAYIANLFLVDSSQIEVLRGSGASLYGSNAQAGTINILTDHGGGPFHGDLDLQGGGLGLFRGVAKVAGGVAHNRLAYSLGVSDLSVTEGVNGAGPARDWTGQGSIDFAIRPNMRVGATVFANKGYNEVDTSPSAPSAPGPLPIYPVIPLPTGIITATASGLNPTFITSLGDPDSGEYSHFVNSVFHFEHDVTSRLSYRIGYGIVDSTRTYTNGPAGPVNEYTSQPLFNTSARYAGRLDTLNARLNYLLGSHQTISAGYEFQRENYTNLNTDQNPDPTQRTNNDTIARQQTNAVFAQDEIRLFSGRLQILLSGRYTKVSLAEPTLLGAALSPYAGIPLPSPPKALTGDAAIAYFVKSSATKFRAHVGNSFRTPSIYERFGGYFYGGIYTPIGDPSLPPERAVSFDAGIDQYLLHERVKLNATYFYSHLQQVIGYANVLPGITDIYGRSAGYYPTPGGIARGAEVSAEIHPSRKTNIKASYVYTNARDFESQYFTGTPVDPLQTPRISPQMFTVVATQQLTKRIDFALDFVGASSYLYPIYGYDVNFNYQPYAYRFAGPKQLGLSGGYTLPLREHLSVRFYGRIYNTLDQTYYAEGFATPGIWAVGGVRLTF